MVNAHLAAVPEQGEREQRRHRPQPEQDVQHEGQRPQPDAPAQGAHSVVHQPKQSPQQDALPENLRLGRDVHIHLSAADGTGTRRGTPEIGRAHV